MRRIALSALLFCGLGAAAQTTNGHWDVSLAGGPSLPMGSFGRKTLGDAGSQYAQAGWNAEVRVGYKLVEGLYLSVAAGHQENSFDNSLMYPPTDYPSYSTWRIVVGPSGRWYPGDQKKFALTASVLGGVEWSGSNEYKGFGDAPFALEAGVGAQYHLSRRCYLKAGADFITAKFKRQADATTLTGPRSSFNPGVGLGLYL